MQRFLRHIPFQLQAVLVDVGASGEIPPQWATLAPYSHYVGFDPDLREIVHPESTPFAKAVMMNLAVTDQPTQTSLQFHLTHSPFCSSTLLPNHAALEQYLYAHLFAVESTTTVQASTLDAVLDQLAIPYAHWLKLDSQGTDVRLFQSLHEERRHKVLAVDVEPGLLDAYQGEDLFPTAHQTLTQQGFWLSHLAVQGTVRGQASTLAKTLGFTPDQLKHYQRALKTSPGWCEARYLRTVAWLEAHHATWDEYLLLAIFACVDNQLAFALDVLTTAQQQHKQTTPLYGEVVSAIREALAHVNRQPTLARRLYRKLRNLL